MKTIDNIHTLFKDSQGDLTTVLSKIFHNDIKIFILNVLIIYLKHLKTLFQNRLNKLISISLYGNIFYFIIHQTNLIFNKKETYLLQICLKVL